MENHPHLLQLIISSLSIEYVIISILTYYAVVEIRYTRNEKRFLLICSIVWPLFYIWIFAKELILKPCVALFKSKRV